MNDLCRLQLEGKWSTQEIKKFSGWYSTVLNVCLSKSLTIFNALSNACYMFHRSTDSFLKAQYHQKRHKKKPLNWLELITEQVQVQVMKGIWY